MDLKSDQIVAGNPGGSGSVTHLTTFRLAAGTYTIVCNVHPKAHQAKRIVVDPRIYVLHPFD
jgi:plastocyanin